MLRILASLVAADGLAAPRCGQCHHCGAQLADNSAPVAVHWLALRAHIRAGSHATGTDARNVWSAVRAVLLVRLVRC
jgi:hypothetical protein